MCRKMKGITCLQSVKQKILDLQIKLSKEYLFSKVGIAKHLVLGMTTEDGCTTDKSSIL